MLNHLFIAVSSFVFLSTLFVKRTSYGGWVCIHWHFVIAFTCFSFIWDFWQRFFVIFVISLSNTLIQWTFCGRKLRIFGFFVKACIRFKFRWISLCSYHSFFKFRLLIILFILWSFVGEVIVMNVAMF